MRTLHLVAVIVVAFVLLFDVIIDGSPLPDNTYGDNILRELDAILQAGQVENNNNEGGVMDSIYIGKNKVMVMGHVVEENTEDAEFDYTSDD